MGGAVIQVDGLTQAEVEKKLGKLLEDAQAKGLEERDKAIDQKDGRWYGILWVHT